MWKCLDVSYSAAVDFVGVLFSVNSAAEEEQSTGHCCLMGHGSFQLRKFPSVLTAIEAWLLKTF